jgi:hypothetical protein
VNHRYIYKESSLEVYEDAFEAMIGENQQLVTNEPVEVQDCRKITGHFREVYRIYPKINKGKSEGVKM